MKDPLFSQMTDEQRTEWLSDFQRFKVLEQPEIEAAKALTKTIRGYFEHGMNLIYAFSYARSFVDESRKFGDYIRRKDALLYHVRKVTNDAQKHFGSVKVDLSDPALLEKHVGAPTADEKKARALAKEKEELDKEKAQTAVQQGLFGDDDNKTHTANETNSTPSEQIARLHLDQLKWLMSPTLAADIDTIRDLRQQASTASTIAKQMALDGKGEAEIAVYTQEAAEATEAYERIYQEVDDEMAIAFVRMKEDETYIAGLKKQGIDLKLWRKNLRPYYDKVENKKLFMQRVLSIIAENDPEQIAKREAEKKVKEESAAIIKYFRRKEKKDPETVKTRYARLVELIGEEEASTYLPLVKEYV